MTLPTRTLLRLSRLARTLHTTPPGSPALLTQDAPSRFHIAKLYALLGRPAPATPGITDHLLHFHAADRPLSPDGYYSDITPGALDPQRFPNPQGFRRRLWARGSVRVRHPLQYGRTYTCLERVRSVRRYRGDTFVSTQRELVSLDDQRTHLVEERTLVYTDSLPEERESPPVQGGGDGDSAAPPPRVLGQHTFSDLDVVRYAQLTCNPHRIHWDRAYAQAVEGYADLLVPGPLTAQLLALYAGDCGSGAPPRAVAYRSTHYAHPGTPLEVCERALPLTDTRQLFLRDRLRPARVYAVLDVLE